MKETTSNTAVNSAYKSSSSAKLLAQAALGVALLTVSSYISIPLVVPFTMQTFALALLLLAFGGRLGCVCILCYLALGAIGIPVFSSVRGGLGVLLGPTGGFFWGMIGYSIVYMIADHSHNSLKAKVLGLVLGHIVLYIFGCLWYAFGYLQDEASIPAVVMQCVVPFILPDIVKTLLAIVIYKRLPKKLIHKHGK